MSESQLYTLRWRGRESGPYPLEEINRRLDEHEIGMGHEICHEDKWSTLEEFFASRNQPGAAAVQRTQARVVPPSPGLPSGNARGIGQASPIPSPVNAPAPVTGNPTIPTRSEMASQPVPGQTSALRARYRVVYALLAIFFGFTGLHNYYARHWLTGVLQLLLSIATFLLGFGVIAPWLWAVVEAVLVRRDGNDLKMI